MLRCRDITLLASDYVDGRLHWRKRLSMLLHLMTCVHCRRFIRQFPVVVYTLRGMPRCEVGIGSHQRLDEAVNEALRTHGENRNSDRED